MADVEVKKSRAAISCCQIIIYRRLLEAEADTYYLQPARPARARQIENERELVSCFAFILFCFCSVPTGRAPLTVSPPPHPPLGPAFVLCTLSPSRGEKDTPVLLGHSCNKNTSLYRDFFPASTINRDMSARARSQREKDGYCSFSLFFSLRLLFVSEMEARVRYGWRVAPLFACCVERCFLCRSLMFVFFPFVFSPGWTDGPVRSSTGRVTFGQNEWPFQIWGAGGLASARFCFLLRMRASYFNPFFLGSAQCFV